MCQIKFVNSFIKHLRLSSNNDIQMICAIFVKIHLKGILQTFYNLIFFPLSSWGWGPFTATMHQRLMLL